MKMDCYQCGSELIWGGDHSYELTDDFDIETNLSCPDCDAHVLVLWQSNRDEAEPEEIVRLTRDTALERISNMRTALTEVRDIASASAGVEFYIMLAENALHQDDKLAARDMEEK